MLKDDKFSRTEDAKGYFCIQKAHPQCSKDSSKFRNQNTETKPYVVFRSVYHLRQNPDKKIRNRRLPIEDNPKHRNSKPN